MYENSTVTEQRVILRGFHLKPVSNNMMFIECSWNHGDVARISNEQFTLPLRSWWHPANIMGLY